MNKIENGVVLSMAEYEHLTKKKKTRTSDVVLVVLGLFLLAFIVTILFMFWRFQQVPDALIDKVLDASQWEVGVLAAIKIAKVVRDGFGKTKESEE